MVDRRKNGRGAYKVLYFITAPAPEDDEREDILQYGPGAVFRNASYIDPDAETGFEPCTAVAGKVPANYARYFPSAVPVEDFHAGMLSQPTALLDPDALMAEGPTGDAPPMTSDPFTVGRPGAVPNWARNTPPT